MTQKKYIMLGWEKKLFKTNQGANILVKVQRIRAVIDIPAHNVKAGDYGGYIHNASNLSHEGSCWVADEAIVYRYVTIEEDALVSGNSYIINRFKRSILTIKGNAKICDRARVSIVGKNKMVELHTMVISGNACIKNNATVTNTHEITDDVVIADNVEVDSALRISGTSTLKEDAKVGKNSTIEGNSRISGNAIIMKNAKFINSIIGKESAVSEKGVVRNSIIPDGTVIRQDQWISSEEVERSMVKAAIEPFDSANTITMPTKPMAVSTRDTLDAEPLFILFASIKDDIAKYETDIVKIIKYPVMVDKTDPYTAKMFMALKRATLLSVNPDERFDMALQDLGEAFMAAESNALKIATTLLNSEAAKKTLRARDLLSIASNEASTEHEKKTAFVQAFKTLEGVLTVPEVAIDAFRAKVGLKEIEV